MNHEEVPAFEVDEDAQGLYATTGQVDIVAVQQYLEQATPAEQTKASILDEVTTKSYDFTVVVDELLDDEDTDASPLDWLGRPGSLKYALRTYMTWLIGQQIHAQRVSANPEFARNPDFTPDLRSEIERALNGTLPLGNPEQAVLEPSPLNVHSLRAVVAIPNASLQEAKNIYQTLANYTQESKLQPHEFEIVVHNNFFVEEGQNDAEVREQYDITLAEITRFQQGNPEITIRQFGTRYETNAPSIATIRADLFNAIAQDLYNRGRQTDILLISNDADTCGTSPDYIGNMVEAYEQSGADIIAGGLDWELIDTLPEGAMANKMLRYQMYIDEIANVYNPHPTVWDANTGLSLATYYAAGGFKRGTEMAEMLELVHTIRNYRSGSQKQYEVLAPQARVTTSSRRLIESMALGYMPYDAWSEEVTGFGHKDSLRTAERRTAGAETNAQAKWQEWTDTMEQRYGDNVPVSAKHRIYNLGKLALGIPV